MNSVLTKLFPAHAAAERILATLADGDYAGEQFTPAPTPKELPHSAQGSGASVSRAATLGKPSDQSPNPERVAASRKLTCDDFAGETHIVIFRNDAGIRMETFTGPDASEKAHARAYSGFEGCITVAVRIHQTCPFRLRHLMS